MSFSSEVKAELLNITNDPCCELAQSYGLLLFGRAFSANELSYLSDSEILAESYSKAAEFLAGTEIAPVKTEGGKYKVFIQDKKILNRIFMRLGFSEDSVKRRVNFANIQNPCCFSAFLRGAFLACATVTNPEKEYHLEFAVSSKGLCDDLSKIFDEYEPTPKTTQRSGSYTVYFKSSSDIEDVLAIIGAGNHSMSYMNAKIEKEVINNVNRLVNCDKANVERTVKAAGKQLSAINKIKEKNKFDSLPPELKEIAQLRLKYPESSNSELSKLLPQKLTVSGINHRFQKLIKIAEDIK